MSARMKTIYLCASVAAFVLLLNQLSSSKGSATEADDQVSIRQLKEENRQLKQKIAADKTLRRELSGLMMEMHALEKEQTAEAMQLLEEKAPKVDILLQQILEIEPIE